MADLDRSEPKASAPVLLNRCNQVPIQLMLNMNLVTSVLGLHEKSCEHIKPSSFDIHTASTSIPVIFFALSRHVFQFDNHFILLVNTSPDIRLPNSDHQFESRHEDERAPYNRTRPRDDSGLERDCICQASADSARFAKLYSYSFWYSCLYLSDFVNGGSMDMIT
jgi:hypothetical protein